MHCAIYQYDSVIFSSHEHIKEFIDNYNRYTMEEKLLKAKENPEHRFVYFFDKDTEFTSSFLQELRQLNKVRNNVVYMLDFIPAKELNIDFSHFLSFSFAAENLDQIKKMGLRSGLTDVYITGEVCFKMNDVSALAKQLDIKIRLIPNFPQALYREEDTEAITSFWIRPEDLHLYEPFVDVIEFLTEDIQLQKTFYDIYFVNKRWNKPLGILIPYLDKVQNHHLTEDFTLARLNCNKVCILNRCHLCHKMESMGSLLQKNQLGLAYNGKKILTNLRKEEEKEEELE